MNDTGYKLSEYDKKMQEIYLGLWSEFDRVAKKHNLKYFLFNGTLIGAVRHKGFIPWDDDFDIAMPRKDYDILQFELAKEFRNPFFLQTILTDPTHFNGLIRLRNSETTMILRYDYGHPCNNGVYMDIYPLDKLPDGKIKNKLLNYTAVLYRQFFYYHVYGTLYPNKDNSGEKGIKQKIIRNLSNITFKLFDEKLVYSFFQHKIGKYRDKDCKYVSAICTHPFRKSNIWFAEDIEEVTYLEFEGNMMPVPKGYDRCMKRRYGNYMELPPKKDRKPIHCTKAYMNPDIPYTQVKWNPFEDWDKKGKV